MAFISQSGSYTLLLVRAAAARGVRFSKVVSYGNASDLDEIDLLDYKHIHVHQICRAQMGSQVGIGNLETICFGRHDPSGFKNILDGAP